jgi:hypothetical protein
MGQQSTERYRVCVFGRLGDGAPLGSLDITQGFGAKDKAERFARAISHRIPAGHGSDGCALAWVLVYAMPDSASGVRQEMAHCYLSFDHGGIVVKRHAILKGFYGYRPAGVVVSLVVPPRSTGDKLLATGPGESLETGAVYTVVAVHDGKMDLECVGLATTVAGVQIDDPNLQPYSEAS